MSEGPAEPTTPTSNPGAGPASREAPPADASLAAYAPAPLPDVHTAGVHTAGDVTAGGVAAAGDTAGEGTSSIDAAGVIATRPPLAKRLRWVWWTAACLAFASMAGVCAYLVVVSRQWSDRVDTLTAVSTDLGNQVASQTAARKAADDATESLKGELGTADSRITDLTNEEANAKDREAVWINYLDAMIECEQGWVKHATVLKGNYHYVGTTTAAEEARLVAYCDGIINDYNKYKADNPS